MLRPDRAMTQAMVRQRPILGMQMERKVRRFLLSWRGRTR
jgi:hypothetical protein